MRRVAILSILAALMTGVITFEGSGATPIAEGVTQLPAGTTNTHYLSNRSPLRREAFTKLPIDQFKPAGWLRKSLERQRDGLAGHLGEISVWLTKKDNAWLNKEGRGQYGWEEVPYWLRGYARIGYLLDDPQMLAEACVWIEGTLNSQRDNGDFGPVQNHSGGFRDLWAQMLMLQVLQSYYEHTHDARVLPFMTRYFQWQMTIPDAQFLKDYWENSRGGDNLASVYWLYNITGEKFLMDLATKIDRNTANWRQKDRLPNWHVVNIAECFREPATYFLQSGNPADLEATYHVFKLVRQMYGQVPGGMFGADENARPGHTDPHQASETCSFVEQIASDGMLVGITGDTFWAENAEDVAFNSMPAAFTPDYRALRYLTAPNMAVSDRYNHAPGVANQGPFLLMNPFSCRCCQHNHSSAWANYSEYAWMATPDNGLAAVLYAAGEVRAKVGDGTEVTISTKTHYPFEDKLTFTVRASRPASFPIYLRQPSWAKDASLRVNGRGVKGHFIPGGYIKVSGTWQNGDTLVLRLPMQVRVREWVDNKNSASVDYGPLTFSLKIDEQYVTIDSARSAISDSRWQPQADPGKWPSFEILPKADWNYGLLLNGKRSEKAFTVVHKDWPYDDFPFTPSAVPIEIQAHGKRIPQWGLDKDGLCGVLPQSPVDTSEPSVPITLIPMGAARLRIAAFPVVR